MTTKRKTAEEWANKLQSELGYVPNNPIPWKQATSILERAMNQAAQEALENVYDYVSKAWPEADDLLDHIRTMIKESK